MLHMIVAIHGPDTCAANVPEVRDMAVSAFQRMDEITAALSIKVQGAWANMPAHAIYIVVDAPNAHVVNQMAREAQLMNWNTVTVTPIVTLQEAIGAVQQ